MIWRPHTTAILIGGVVLIVLAAAIAFMTSNFSPRTEVQIGSGIFQVKIADTDNERTQGLSGVETLQVNEGMLFDFMTEDKWTIWMKDMLIDLDIIWLDAEKTVVHIVKDADHTRGEDAVFIPNTAARYVLELPAGTTSEYTITVGSKAAFVLGEQ